MCSLRKSYEPGESNQSMLEGCEKSAAHDSQQILTNTICRVLEIPLFGSTIVMPILDARIFKPSPIKKYFYLPKYLRILVKYPAFHRHKTNIDTLVLPVLIWHRSSTDRCLNILKKLG